MVNSFVKLFGVKLPNPITEQQVWCSRRAGQASTCPPGSLKCVNELPAAMVGVKTRILPALGCVNVLTFLELAIAMF